MRQVAHIGGVLVPQWPFQQKRAVWIAAGSGDFGCGYSRQKKIDADGYPHDEQERAAATCEVTQAHVLEPSKAPGLDRTRSLGNAGLMDRRRSVSSGGSPTAIALLLLLLLLVFAAPSTAAAQVGWDPAAAISAYSAALNAHDLASALALFDENASADISSGRHFAGQAGLTEFLMRSGFGDPEAHITTRSLLVVANRANWTYMCSCADGSTDVRIVLNDQNKISVFAIMAPTAKPLRTSDARGFPWLAGLALVVAAMAVGLGLRRRRPAAPTRRASQGHLLAALVQARAPRGGVTRSGVPTESVSNYPPRP